MGILLLSLAFLSQVFHPKILSLTSISISTLNLYFEELRSFIIDLAHLLNAPSMTLIAITLTVKLQPNVKHNSKLDVVLQDQCSSNSLYSNINRRSIIDRLINNYSSNPIVTSPFALA